MSNEASIIANPTSTPAAVSTGYQAQNVILTALMNGIDCSNVIGGVGQCTVKISGPVDVNGVLYSIAQDAILGIVGAAANYCIYLDGAGNNLTPTLTTNFGTFDPSKNARYTAGGKRILNWIIRFDGTNAFTFHYDIPRINFLDNGTPYYTKIVLATISGANPQTFAHNILNARTNNRILSIRWTFGTSSSYYDTLVQDVSSASSILSISWDDTNISVVRAGTAVTLYYRFEINYL